jgi:phospho-N-acetylmuramoyl-pentapeptide-transferase
MVAAVVIGPRFIELLRMRNLGQQIRAEGPATHVVKQGTPTMGGLLIIASAIVPFLVLSKYTADGLTVLFMVLGCALIGFTDDYLKVHRRRSLGLPGRWKMIGLVAVTVGAALILNESSTFTTDVYVPIANWTLDLSWGYYVLLFLVIGGTVNGANLTDGIDGLAAGTVVIMLLTYLAVAGIAWIRSGSPGDRSETYLDIATLAAALLGGTIGFLWYNAFPAEVIMGDTGAMGIGGALAAFAIFTQTISLLLLIGGIFLIEALSVIIQVVSFKYWGRRVFLITPIHHHFEMKAWSETKIMVRFWIVTAILCALGFALFYRDFTFFRR